MEILKVKIEHSAQTWANMIGSMAQVKGRDLDDAKKVRVLLSTEFQKRGNLRFDEDKVEGEVRVCPFSNAPPEICHQYHQFVSDTLSVLEIPYELVGDSLMTNGDKSCHWTIRKKGQTAQPKSEAGLDDPIRRLTNKFIDGEITEEEFDKKMAHLRKHGIVK
jgi:hypothetical protein